MQYRKLGKTNLNVSALGLGCMRLPDAEGVAARGKSPDLAMTTRLVEQVLEKGVNYFDTAYPYHDGKSEAILGQALATTKARKNVCIATKIPASHLQKPETWTALFEEQCANLCTDYVDVYLVHAMNETRWQQFKENGGLEFFSRLKSEGKVRYLGFSFHDSLPVFMDVLEGFTWDMCQLQFNYMDRHYQAGLAGLAEATKRGLGVISMEPLKGGALARRPPEAIQAVWDATNRNYSPAEWALRWVLDHAGLSCALSGMHNATELAENVRVASEHMPDSLTPEDLSAIDKVTAIYTERQKVNCTACRYCMPCPAGVDIPNTFGLYNSYSLFGDTRLAYLHYNIIAKGNNTLASNCVACGQCESECPHGVPIIQSLQEAHEVLSLLPNT